MVGNTYVCIESYDVIAATEDNKLTAFRINAGDEFVCIQCSDTLGAVKLANDERQIGVEVPLSRLQYHFKLKECDPATPEGALQNRSLSELSGLKCELAFDLYKKIPEDISSNDYTLLLSMLITELSTSLAKTLAVDKD